MPEYTLTLLDTAAIQNYVFGSNVLRENVGGSELVWRATRQRAFEAARASGRTNVRLGELTGDRADLLDALQIERDDLDAEVIYAGGGNCAILFAERPRAIRFVERLSRVLLEEARDLELVIAHEAFNWDSDALGGKTGRIEAAFVSLNKAKLERRVSMPLRGLGPTMACGSTGLPAVGTDTEDDLKPSEEPARALSAGILDKLRAVPAANQRLAAYLPQFGTVGMTIPHDLDNLGRSAEEMSYLAVVHADGNSMGARTMGLREEFPSPAHNRSYIIAMRDFSAAVDSASQQALKRLGDILLRHWDPKNDSMRGILHDDSGGLITPDKPEVYLRRTEKAVYAPFRPIVFGGDDLTFVTDGRLGLALAAHYLAEFGRAVAEQGNHYLAGLQACVGVAVVKTHYPFARAYELAEGLCKNAKQEFKREYAALDWHFASTGLFGDVKEIRERHYQVPAGDLAMRPIALDDRHMEWRTWPRFSAAVRQFAWLGSDWVQHRNKLIGLLTPLREGPKAVAQYLHAYGPRQLPLLAQEVPDLQETGWSAGRCGYFDLIEALDFYLPLEG